MVPASLFSQQAAQIGQVPLMCFLNAEQSIEQKFGIRCVAADFPQSLDERSVLRNTMLPLSYVTFGLTDMLEDGFTSHRQP
jgi:hypothetical protein